MNMDAILNHYSKRELQRHNNINKYLKLTKNKRAKLEKQIEALDQQENMLLRERNKIEDKVDKRKARKCKHDSIYGPYECSRDDCSGGHHRCQNCGNQVDDASPELFKKTGKKWIAWNEKYS